MRIRSCCQRCEIVILSMKTFVLTSLILLLSVSPISGAAGQMALEDVRPGMTGVGMTVFEGTTPEEFEVHVLGILRNINGPKRNLILARLSGGPLDVTGVIQLSLIHI